MASLFHPKQDDDLNSLKEYLEEESEETFAEKLETFKSYKPTEYELIQLQNHVWKFEVSPYHYVKGLEDLKPHVSKTLLKKLQHQFEENLASYPAFIDMNLQRDLLLFLKHPAVKDIQETHPSIENLEDLLAYYRGIQNPLDYTNTLVGFRRLIQRETEVA